VRWYGGGWRNVEVVSGTSHWFKSGKGLVPIIWVFVRDLDGAYRDEYFFSTDTKMPASEIIEMYGGRRNVETTLQEMRAHLGLETTRGWHRKTVLRMAPCLLSLYTIVVVFYDTMPRTSPHLQTRQWIGKNCVTFSDMIINVRPYLWMNWVFERMPNGADAQKLSNPIRKLLHFGLTQAA